MAVEQTITITASRWRLRFMATHPITGELHYPGDVITFPESMITPGQRADAVFIPVPDDTPENITPRDEPSKMIGYNVSEEEYLASTVIEALGGELPPALLSKARGAARPQRMG